MEGMDMFKAFDLNNEGAEGTIHQVILARALHVFDQSVFTLEVVQQLLDDLVALCPDRTDGCVPLKVLVDHLQQRPPSVRRNVRTLERKPTKTEETLSSAMDTYTDSLVMDIRGFKELVQPGVLVDAAGTSPEEILALKLDLKDRAKKYVLDAQRSNICPIWDEFDKDGNGVLDPDECDALVAAYLHTMARKSSEVIRGYIELGIELSLIIAEKTVKDEPTKERMRAHARLQVEAIHANVAPLVQHMMDTMAEEEAHNIAGELLASLDYDGDGKVTRDDFETRFVESMRYVLGPEGLTDKLQHVNSLT